MQKEAGGGDRRAVFSSPIPQNPAGRSYLFNLLDLCVVITGGDLWVWLDLLIVFEQSGDLRSSTNETLLWLCGLVVHNSNPTHVLGHILCFFFFLAIMDVSFSVYYISFQSLFVEIRSIKSFKIIKSTNSMKMFPHLIIFTPVSCEPIDTVYE